MTIKVSETSGFFGDVPLKKPPWIIRQQSYFLYSHPRTPARKFIFAETPLYPERQY